MSCGAVIAIVINENDNELVATQQHLAALLQRAEAALTYRDPATGRELTRADADFLAVGRLRAATECLQTASATPESAITSCLPVLQRAGVSPQR